ncbi:MAG: 16S rRNA (guanine(966)-N(2))-methyltransferase RsmD [bacterium]
MQIISGTLKSRRLYYPKNRRFRPTQAKVKEAIFNIAQSYVDIKDCHVLDLCCGTGALGLEAYSRGAKSVYFVDRYIQYIQKNISTLNLEQVPELRIKKQDAAQFLKQYKDTVDLIFFDPPWDNAELYERVFTQLLDAPYSTRNTLIFFETRRENNTPNLPDSTSIKCYNYSSTNLTLLQHHAQ